MNSHTGGAPVGGYVFIFLFLSRESKAFKIVCVFKRIVVVKKIRHLLCHNKLVSLQNMNPCIEQLRVLSWIDDFCHFQPSAVQVSKSDEIILRIL